MRELRFVAMSKKADPYRPSEELREAVRFNIGVQILTQQAQEQRPA